MTTFKIDDGVTNSIMKLKNKKGGDLMSTKKQKIADILDAISQIKAHISQDSGKNPILKEIYDESLNKLFNKLYDAERSQFKKTTKTSKAKSRESKNQNLYVGQKGDSINAKQK